MKQNVRRILALLIALAMAMTVIAVAPATVYASETAADADEVDEPYADEPQAEPTPAPNATTVTITQETSFSFTPNATGYWTFATGDGIGENAPRITVINDYGHFLASGSMVTLHLVEGAPYIINAGCIWSWDGEFEGSFVLTVYVSDEFVPVIRTPLVAVTIPGAGGYSSGHSDLFYSFTPEVSGLWEFRITPAFGHVEWFELRDWDHNTVAFSMDNEREFHGTIRLTADVKYTVNAWVDWEAPYVISIKPAETFVPWMDWDMAVQNLNAEGAWLDLELEKQVIPPHGGNSDVDNVAGFTFTPDTTGPWTFRTESSARYIAMPLLIVTDAYGSFFTWDGFGWNEPNMILDLAQGVEYVIWLSSTPWCDDTNFTLIVEPYDAYYWDWDLWDDFDLEEHTRVYTRIPSEGGYVSADDIDFMFSPAHTGSWTIKLSSPGWGELMISDYSGSFRLDSWDTEAISMHMAAGTEYVMTAWASWGWDATLSVSPTYEITLPSTATSAHRRIVRESEFAFTPNQTGYWIIYTSNRVDTTDPYLWLLDAEGNIIAQDDDNGESLNALIKIHLEAGARYTIRAGYFMGSGEYMLTVRIAGASQPERELVVLAPPV